MTSYINDKAVHETRDTVSIYKYIGVLKNIPMNIRCFACGLNESGFRSSINQVPFTIIECH